MAGKTWLDMTLATSTLAYTKSFIYNKRLFFLYNKDLISVYSRDNKKSTHNFR